MKCKKFLWGVAIFAMAMTSCGNSAKSGSDTVAQEESVEAVAEECTDSNCADEACNDSIVTRGGTAGEGFGRCLKSGCNCKSFEGRGQTCGNCGHAYSKHY